MKISMIDKKKVIERAIRELDEVQNDLNRYGIDESDKGNRAYNLIDDAKSWLKDLRRKNDLKEVV